jgi:hypothetical protein
MTLVTGFCHMSSVRSTSDGRGPVTRKRVPDREEQGKPSKDARRGRCHPLEAGFWPLWMTPLPRNPSHKSQVTSYTARGIRRCRRQACAGSTTGCQWLCSLLRRRPTRRESPRKRIRRSRDLSGRTTTARAPTKQTRDSQLDQHALCSVRTPETLRRIRRAGCPRNFPQGASTALTSGVASWGVPAHGGQ